MTAADIQSFKSQPASQSCRLIDFDSAQVVPGIVKGTWFLTVGGTKPWANIDVSLRPLIYIDKPEYWVIEVVGCSSGIGLPQTAPFWETLEITQFVGHKGIEVVGASKSQKIEVS